MLRAPLLAAVCFGLLTLAPAAEAAKPVRGAAPRNLHGFLLRADEPVDNSFTRTPSFAWNPVPGAIHYQFQLATSSTFRENAILYSTDALTTPVAAPPLILPWIDGMLQARVRAIFPRTSSSWSSVFAFDLRPQKTPSPLPSYPGVLRWTPVEGADGYEVWFIDTPSGKKVTSYTNVLDEREFYTFHRSPAWTDTVRWRVRALRHNSGQPQNGIPAVTYGPWSDVYESRNAPYAGGQIKLIGTLSDVFSASLDSSATPHKLMPAFLFSGDQAFDGTSAELFRIYVFTDKGCINRVFASAVIGGPAYAPRPHGTLSMPSQPAAVFEARSTYLPDGDEPPSFTYDGEPVHATESLPPPSPTTSVPTDSDSGVASAPSPVNGAQGTQSSVSESIPGAPVDLWDTETHGGYWWTVIPVVAVSPGEASSVAGTGVAALSDTIEVVNAGDFAPGDGITIGRPGNQETANVIEVSGSKLKLNGVLVQGHAKGEPVVRQAGDGSLRYHDLELAQDVCAKGRVARFAKNSEPTLTAAGELFASGLSSKGRLVSGLRGGPFYGSPLVSWTPALGASAYEVQWSRHAYPFHPEPDPQNQNSLGRITLGTSTVLPLKPGTWYYRVRGFNYALPTGAQQMSWSDPARIVVAKPKFKIVKPGK